MPPPCAGRQIVCSCGGGAGHRIGEGARPEKLPAGAVENVNLGRFHGSGLFGREFEVSPILELNFSESLLAMSHSVVLTLSIWIVSEPLNQSFPTGASRNGSSVFPFGYCPHVPPDDLR